MTTRSTQQTGKRSAPSHIVYNAQERTGGKNTWTKVGAAWQHSDGEGFTLQLEAIPVGFDGRLTLRRRNNKANRQGEGR